MDRPDPSAGTGGHERPEQQQEAAAPTQAKIAPLPVEVAAALVGFPFQGTAAGIFAGVGGAPSARGREVTVSATEC